MLKTITAALGVVLLGTAAATATPVLSGAYTVTARDLCQQRLIADFNNSGGPNVVDALNFSSGDVPSAQTLITAKFIPAKSKITVTGFVDEGSGFLLQSTGSKSGSQGTALNERVQSGSISYSNTDTTITIGNRTYNAIYGQIDKNGIAHTMAFMGLYTDGNPPDTCSEQDEAIRQ